jgi:hypothetical protein
MTTTLVLTADELRVAAKVSGSDARVVDGGWAEEDLAVADVVALRGLLARGLATTRTMSSGVELTLTIAARGALAPLLRPELVIEVSRDTATGGQRWLIGQAAAGTVVAEEREPDIWRVRPADAPVPDVVTAIVADLTGGLLPGPTGTVVTVPTSVLVDAERHRLTRDPAAVVAELTDAGLPDGAAATVATVLADLEAFVTVRLTSSIGGVRVTDALTWLEAGRSGVWLAVPTHVDGPADALSADDRQYVEDLPYLDELDSVTELTAVCPADVQAALTGLLDGTVHTSRKDLP